MTSYLEDSEGKFIPPTQRPDGTWRKARRVKDGYVPQEEVPLYESKGKQFAQRNPGLPPGMCPIAADAAKKERERKERAKAKKEAATNNKAGLIVIPANNKETKIHSAPTSTATTVKSNANNMVKVANSASTVDSLSDQLLAALTVQDDPGEREKNLKKLRKKLREIEAIEEKIKNGELKKPEQDQLEKVKRKKEVVKEIKRLEAKEEQQ